MCIVPVTPASRSSSTRPPLSLINRYSRFRMNFSILIFFAKIVSERLYLLFSFHLRSVLFSAVVAHMAVAARWAIWQSCRWGYRRHFVRVTDCYFMLNQFPTATGVFHPAIVYSKLPSHPGLFYQKNSLFQAAWVQD